MEGTCGSLTRDLGFSFCEMENSFFNILDELVAGTDERIKVQSFDTLDEFVVGNKDVREPQVPPPVMQNSALNRCSIQ